MVAAHGRRSGRGRRSRPLPRLRRGGITVSLAVILIVVLCRPALPAGEVPARKGCALVLGNTYDPSNDITFVMLSGFVLYDYDSVWPHRAPDPLRFKVEGNLGGKVQGDVKAMASAGVLALYYLDGLSSVRLRPFLEAGIGIIYTDHRVEGQGLKINFNPQAGFGLNVNMSSGAEYFASFRLHHLSNGGLDDDNRGVNSAVLLIGRFF